MSRTVSQQIISGALTIISDRRRWTQHVAMRAGSGQLDAWRYCAFGALARSADEFSRSSWQARDLVLSAEKAIADANGWKPGTRISKFNDENTHSAVVAALTRAVR